MKKRLIILSDLWGKTNADWENQYLDYLRSAFNISYYDSCELGKIDKSNYSQNALHQQFINNGIDKAVHNLLELEQHEITVLAFSIGGTIAWKAALKGLKVNQLIAISATRLRYETIKPNCTIELFFGEHDVYKPKLSWFDDLKIEPHFIENKHHEMYQNFKLIQSIFSLQ